MTEAVQLYILQGRGCSCHKGYSQYFLPNLMDMGLGLREYIRDYTRLQEGPPRPLFKVPYSANIDSNS